MALFFRFLTNYEASLLATRYVLTGLLLFYLAWPESRFADSYVLPAVLYYLLSSVTLHLLYKKTEKRWSLWYAFLNLDLLVTSVMVYGSGGLSSDLYFIYLVSFGMAAYMYKWRSVLVHVSVANLLYAVTLWLATSSELTPRDFVMRMTFFSIISLLFPVYTMVDQERRRSLAEHAILEQDKERLTQEKNRLIHEMESISRQVAEYTFDLHNLAVTDQLTGLHNHTYFHSQLIIEVEKSKQTGKPMSLLLMDIDNFKRVNDTYGHLIGDEVLKTISICLKEMMADTYYTPCRAGGEEMSVILPDVGPEQAYEFADLVRKAIADVSVPLLDDQLLKVSVSVGVATFPISALNHQQLIDHADQAMYAAKTSGKNRTCVYSPTIEESTHTGH